MFVWKARKVGVWNGKGYFQETILGPFDRHMLLIMIHSQGCQRQMTCYFSH